MTLRQVVLDTETTGLRIEDGHRIIELGCVELIDRKLTGNYFHRYLNPERDVEREALAVHGIDIEFLQDKPRFKEIFLEFIQFIDGAELIIHNAEFDVAFLNYEITLVEPTQKLIKTYCKIIDTLQMARQIHVGQRNSLDALCKRYNVDNAKRDLHGALLDANLLAQVYLRMTGGQGSFFDSLNEINKITVIRDEGAYAKNYKLIVLKATEEELSLHQKYIELLKQSSGFCLWDDKALEVV